MVVSHGRKKWVVLFKWKFNERGTTESQQEVNCRHCSSHIFFSLFNVICSSQCAPPCTCPLILKLSKWKIIYVNTHFFFSPEGFEHKITVQASPSVDKRKAQGSENTTPPASPGVIPRLRAIRCECEYVKKPQVFPVRESVKVCIPHTSFLCPSDADWWQ